MDRVCQMIELGDRNAARIYLCGEESAIRDAYFAAGQPCPQDREKWAKQQQAAQVVPASSGPAPKRPAWCNKARPTTDASRAYVLEQCGQ